MDKTINILIRYYLSKFIIVNLYKFKINNHIYYNTGRLPRYIPNLT